MKKTQKTTILTSLLFLIVGFLLFQNPGGVVKFITYIFGGIFLFMGIVYLLQYYKEEEKQFLSSELYSGVISVIIGVIVMFCAGAIEMAIRFITGGWILYRAFIDLKYALFLKDQKSSSWKVNALVSFLLLVVGLYIILRSNLVLSSIGFILMFYAVIELVGTLCEIFTRKKEL